MGFGATEKGATVLVLISFMIYSPFLLPLLHRKHPKDMMDQQFVSSCRNRHSHHYCITVCIDYTRLLLKMQ